MSPILGCALLLWLCVVLLLDSFGFLWARCLGGFNIWYLKVLGAFGDWF